MKFAKSLFPAVAMICLAGCDTPTTTTQQLTTDSTKAITAAPAEEKVFIINPLKDESSVHNQLRPLAPYTAMYPKSYLPDSISRQLATNVTVKYTSDTMKLHVKGDSCWIEYISAGMSRAKRKDGTIWEAVSDLNEIQDTIVIR